MFGHAWASAWTLGFEDVDVLLGDVPADPVFGANPAGLGDGSRQALGIVDRSAFQMGSFIVTAAIGGLTLVVSANCHGVHSMSATASVDRLLSCRSSNRSREKHTSLASNNVFISAKILPQPTTTHKLHLTFLQVCT